MIKLLSSVRSSLVINCHFLKLLFLFFVIFLFNTIDFIRLTLSGFLTV